MEKKRVQLSKHTYSKPSLHQIRHCKTLENRYRGRLRVEKREVSLPYLELFQISLDKEAESMYTSLGLV